MEKNNKITIKKRTPFLTEITPLRDIAHSIIRKMFKNSLISVARSSDKVVGLPKRGRENKARDPSVDITDLLKNI